MSVGPSLGIIGSVASAPITQRTASSDAASITTARQHAEITNDTAAAEAAGIGKTDGEEHQTNERDADGRLAYESREKQKQADADQQNADPSQPTEEPHLSKDLTGDSGGSLDLVG